MESTFNTKELFREGTDFPFQKADWEDECCDDEITLAARKAFGITYLYPWQRIVIANIMDSAGGEEIPCEEEVVPCENSIPREKEAAVSESDAPYENSTPREKEAAVSENDVPYENSTPCDTPPAPALNNDIFCHGKQIVLLPTGAGKSLCFLTPALILNGPTLVLYPLLALMADQKRRMDEGGLTSVIFRGGQSTQEREENFKKLENGAKIILANPEVLQNENLVERLAEYKIQHIAIDEAHCVSEWGDSFRPAYLTLGTIIKKLKCRTVTAFTATASPQVLNRIAEILFDGNAHIVRSESDRPNIHYTVINAYAKKRAAFLLAISQPKPLIIFCGTRSKSEDMARELAAYYGTDKVKFYHAGLEKEEKDYVEKWFYPRTDAILCCTCAFGMGVDKKDIHTVIHLEPSPTAESYIQEAGRGGRDGSVANAILLWSKEDSLKAESFAEGSRERVLKKFAEATTCRRQILLDALGGEQAVCDGCDICERKKTADFARDARLAQKIILHNPRVFSKDAFSKKIIDKLNAEDYKKTGIKIWEHSDAKSIISQLELAGFIHKNIWPYKGLYSASGKNKIQKKVEKFIFRHFPVFQKLFLPV